MTRSGRPTPGEGSVEDPVAADTTRSPVDEVVSGRSAATPAWAIMGVALAVGALFAVAVALAALAYLLA